MPDQSAQIHPPHGHRPTGEQWLTTLASLTAGACFLSLWFWLLPRLLGLEAKAVDGEPWRWLAAIPSALGFAVALRCIWDFGWTGRGTPIPAAPPQRLVVVGFYRYVRNPMYVGFAAGWLGLWIIFGHANPAVIASAAAVALGIHLFVVFYEEPTLRGKFGDDYIKYCRNVRRWWPHLRPWDSGLPEPLTEFERKLEIVKDANHKPEAARDSSLEVLGDELDRKIDEASNHSKRVTAFTIAIARIMGFNDEQVRLFARGAFLHNIGMMAIPRDVLQKRGALTPEEGAILREHCRHGYEMVHKIPFLTAAAEIILSHHEHWDGTGYPRALRGEQIPIGARIFAVAAAMEELTTKHGNRLFLPLNAAKEEIQRGSGSKFEPSVVNAFLAMPDHIWDDLRNEIDSGAQPGH